MSPVGIMPIQATFGGPRNLVSAFGLKAEGVATLMRLRAGAPAPYEVPPAWVVPARCEGTLISSDLRRAFDDLTLGMRENAVLMARGSSLRERPGESPTLSSRFSPNEIDASFRRFENIVHRVHGAGDDMGVVLMPMMGALKVFRDGASGFGWDNVSFVADTHHPMAPRDMHLAIVSGLGTRAVAAGGEAVFVTADRASGLINSLVNKTEKAFLTPFQGSRPCFARKDYRQKDADYFDFGRDAIVSRPLESEFFEWFRYDPQTGDRRVDIPRIFFGRLVHRYEEVSLARQRELRETPGFRPQEMDVGVNPFFQSDSLANLIGLLQYFSSQIGSVQLEGAFLNGFSAVPYLYQLQETPESVVSMIPLGLTTRHLHSDQVLGVSNFHGPLLWAHGATAEILREWDLEFAKTGYVLLLQSHEGRLIEATPHCRIRLSTGSENMGSHSVALARLKMREAPEAGYLLAQNVRIAAEGNGLVAGGKADRERDGVRLYRNVHLQANGLEMAVEFL